jgi:DNA-binding protein H-NS
LAISNILAQNSNLLAQNLELQRQMEQLRASLNKARDDEMEKWKRELREEVKDMIEGAMRKLVDTLAELQPAPSSRSGQQVGARAASREFEDPVNDHSSSHDNEVMANSPYPSGQSPWNIDKGKSKAVEGVGGGGVDPNALRIRGTRPTFTSLENDLGSEGRMGGMDLGWEDYVDMSPLSRNITEQLSQAVDNS